MRLPLFVFFFLACYSHCVHLNKYIYLYWKKKQQQQRVEKKSWYEFSKRKWKKFSSFLPSRMLLDGWGKRRVFFFTVFVVDVACLQIEIMWMQPKSHLFSSLCVWNTFFWNLILANRKNDKSMRTIRAKSKRRTLLATVCLCVFYTYSMRIIEKHSLSKFWKVNCLNN